MTTITDITVDLLPYSQMPATDYDGSLPLMFYGLCLVLNILVLAAAFREDSPAMGVFGVLGTVASIIPLVLTLNTATIGSDHTKPDDRQPSLTSAGGYLSTDNLIKGLTSSQKYPNLTVVDTSTEESHEVAGDNVVITADANEWSVNSDQVSTFTVIQKQKNTETQLHECRVQPVEPSAINAKNHTARITLECEDSNNTPLVTR